MPRTRFILGLFVFYIVNCWIFTDAANSENGTESNTSHVDVDMLSRRTAQQFSADHKIKSTAKSEGLRKNKNVNHTENLFASGFDGPNEEVTDMKTHVQCENVQFLLKILTVMLPLLRNEVPASTRTSYILYVLKDLLRSSPEATYDYQIMYKINDLLATLEKYHDRYLDERYMNSPRKTAGDKKIDEMNFNALRQLETPYANRVKSRIVFKYEVPQLANADCTAELLTIIKVVQNAIKRLLDNPMCNFNVPINHPILLEVEQHLANPNLYSYDQTAMPLLVEKDKLLIPQNYDLLDIDVPKDTLSDFKSKPTDSHNYYGKSPYQQKLPTNLKIPQNDPLYNYPQYSEPDGKDNSYSSYQNEVAPDIFKIINYIKDQSKNVPVGPKSYSFTPWSTYNLNFPKNEQDVIVSPPILPYNIVGAEPIPIYGNSYNFVPKEDAPLRPWLQPKTPFDVTGDGFGEIQFNNIPNLEYESDILPKEKNGLETVNIPYGYGQPSPSLEIYGDYDSTEIKIVPGHNIMQEKLSKKPSSFGIDGSPNVADVPLNLYPYDSSLHFIPYAQKPSKNLNKYDTLPQNLPLTKGLPDIPIHLNQPFYTNSNKYPLDFSTNIYPNHKREPKRYPSYWDILNQKTTNLVPESPEIKFQYQDNYYQHPGWTIEKEYSKPLPGYDYPKSDNVILGSDLNLNRYYTPVEESIIIPEYTTKYPPGAEIEYAVPKITLPYSKISDTDDSLPDFNAPENDNKLWSPNKISGTILPQPNLVPDNKILLIIKDNIQVMERKIPHEQLSTEIRDMIQNIKYLTDLKQITMEEYVNIINQYQILIEYLKHLNISTAIMKELILSMTNLDKLDLQTGKSQIIELTYLVKRPEPLIYQPYYYIKYRLPYHSFLTRVERLLSENPYLIKNPAQLYKVLISMSNVAETSPDLEKYGKEDILRLTYNKGTLVGAKVIKGADIDMYNALERLKYMNTDMSVEDVYKMIQNLDANLKHTAPGLVLENSNAPAFNIGSRPDKIRIIKLKKQPLIQKITKITTNKQAADDILEDILSKVNVLRSNITPQNLKERSADSLESDTHKTTDSALLIGRSKDIYDVNQLYNNNVPRINLENIYSKNYLPEKQRKNYLKVLGEPTYYVENDAKKSLKSKVKEIDDSQEWVDQYLNPKKAAGWDETLNAYDKKHSSPKKTAWWDKTTNEYVKKTNLPKQTTWKDETINAYNKKNSLPKETSWWGETIHELDKKLTLPKNTAWWSKAINEYDKKPSIPKINIWKGEAINAYDKIPILPKETTWWGETTNEYDNKPILPKKNIWSGEAINVYDKKPSLPKALWGVTTNEYDKNPTFPKQIIWSGEAINAYDKKPSLPKAWWGETMNAYDNKPTLPKQTISKGEVINVYDKKPSLPKDTTWWGESSNEYNKKPTLPKQTAWLGENNNAYDKKPSLPKETAWWGDTINVYDKKPSLSKESAWWGETINGYDKKPSLPKETAWWGETINAYDKKPSLPKQTAWWGDNKNAYNKKSRNYNLQSDDFDSNKSMSKTFISNLADHPTSIDSSFLMKQLHPITETKLIDASKVKNKINDPKDKKYYDSGYPKTSSSSSTTNINNHQVEHSKTYSNGHLVEHSKSYLVDKPDVIQQYNTNPVIYNVEHLQSFIDYPHVTKYGINPNEIKEPTFTNHAMESQTLPKRNSFPDYYDSANRRSNYQNLNLQHAYMGVNPIYLYDQPFNFGKNLGLYNQHFLPNNIMNLRFRHMVDNRLPFLYKFNRKFNRMPRALTRQFIG